MDNTVAIAVYAVDPKKKIGKDGVQATLNNMNALLQETTSTGSKYLSLLAKEFHGKNLGDPTNIKALSDHFRFLASQMHAEMKPLSKFLASTFPTSAELQKLSGRVGAVSVALLAVDFADAVKEERWNDAASSVANLGVGLMVGALVTAAGTAVAAPPLLVAVSAAAAAYAISLGVDALVEHTDIGNKVAHWVKGLWADKPDVELQRAAQDAHATQLDRDNFFVHEHMRNMIKSCDLPAEMDRLCNINAQLATLSSDQLLQTIDLLHSGVEAQVLRPKCEAQLQDASQDAANSTVITAKQQELALLDARIDKSQVLCHFLCDPAPSLLEQNRRLLVERELESHERKQLQQQQQTALNYQQKGSNDHQLEQAERQKQQEERQDEARAQLKREEEEREKRRLEAEQQRAMLRPSTRQ